MPTPSETSALLADLQARLGRVVEAARAEGRARALNEIRSLVGAGAPARRGPGRPPKAAASASSKPKKRDGRANSWSKLTPAQRLDRVNRLRAAKGLPPRSE